MLNRKINILSKYKQLCLIILAYCFMSANAQATNITAGIIMDKMSEDERYGYVAGVIEGLAYARYVKDNPDKTGSGCIYDWYYKDNKERWLKTLLPTFTKHKEKPVGVILYVLTKKECGE